MRGAFLIGIAVLGVQMFAPVQARAADHLDCALNLVDDSVSHKVFSSYRAGKNLGDALMSVKGTEITACRAVNGWTSQSYNSALRVVFGEILSKGSGRDLNAMGVPVDRLRSSIETFLYNLSPDEQKMAADGDISDDLVAPLLLQLEHDMVIVLDALDEKKSAEIGGYLSARANAVYFRAMFATQ